MRVTNLMMANSMSQSLSKATENLLKAQNTVSTEKTINQPSDNPVGLANVLGYQTTLASINQYSQNISQAQSVLNPAESTLGDITNVLNQAKSLALSMANDTTSSADRQTAATEIQSLQTQLVQLANTKQGNRYLFGGQNTTTPPYDPNSPSNGFQGDDTPIPVVVGNGVTVDTHVSGTQAFNSTVDPVVVLSNLMTALNNNDTTGISNQLSTLDQAISQIADSTAQVGDTLDQLNTASSHWSEIKLNLQQSLSNTQDVDLTQAATNLANQQNAYQAALSVASKMAQRPSLVNYLSTVG